MQVLESRQIIPQLRLKKRVDAQVSTSVLENDNLTLMRQSQLDSLPIAISFGRMLTPAPKLEQSQTGDQGNLQDVQKMSKRDSDDGAQKKKGLVIDLRRLA